MSGQVIIEFLRRWGWGFVPFLTNHLPGRNDDLGRRVAGQKLRLRCGPEAESLVESPGLGLPTLVAETVGSNKPVPVAELAASLTDPNLIYNQLFSHQQSFSYWTTYDTGRYYPAQEASCHSAATI